MTLFSITTLGCKINQYESAALSGRLRTMGFRQLESSSVLPGKRANLLVFNTCCVTATAMQKSRQVIRRQIRLANDPFVLIVGCYASYDKKQLRGILSAIRFDPGKAFICGHQDDLEKTLAELAQRLNCHSDRPQTNISPLDHRKPGLPSVDSPGHPACDKRTFQADIKARRILAVKRKMPGISNLKPVDNFPHRQRAFVKVQEGCDAFCSYCIVPYTRPVVRSRPAEEIFAECNNLVRAGYREIVLSGVFLGAYDQASAIRRNWTPDRQLPELIRKIAGIDGLWRVRLSSLEPMDATDELLKICRGLPNFAPHFHLPLQSGSQKILRKMNRQYTAGQFQLAADRIRKSFDRPAITTDIIVGFHDETEEDFRQTMEMADFCGFSKIHAFPFSPIEGTAAWKHRDKIPPAGVVKRRMKELASLEKLLAEKYRSQFVGQSVEAIVEGPDDSDFDADGPETDAASPVAQSGKKPAKAKNNPPIRRALTDRYLTVFFSQPESISPAELTGRIVSLKILATQLEGINGSYISHA